MLEKKQFQNHDALTGSLASEIEKKLRQDIYDYGVASIAVSGGRTPVDLFEALSQKNLDWSKVIITLVDERWVDPSDNASNEQLVREHLLVSNASHAKFIPLKSQHPQPYDAIDSLNEHLSQLPAIFTVVILGMGEDAHTASFFPGAKTLSSCLDMANLSSCCAVTPPIAPHDRMTLTLPRILKSRWIVLHLIGHSKLTVLENALSDGEVEKMPVRSILKQDRAPVSVYLAI